MTVYSILFYLEICAFYKLAVIAVLVKCEAALSKLVDIDFSENNVAFLVCEVVLHQVGCKRIVVVVIGRSESVNTECNGNRLFVACKVSDYSCCNVNVIVLTNLLEVLKSDCALVIAEGILNHFQYIRLLHTLEADGSHTSCGIDVTVLNLRCDRILEYHVVLIRRHELHDRLGSVDDKFINLDYLCRVACKVCVIDFNCVISVVTVVNACGVIISAAAKSAHAGCRYITLLDISSLVDLHITCTEVVLMNSYSCCSGILVILAVLRTVVVKRYIDYRDGLIDGECLGRCSLICHSSLVSKSVRAIREIQGIIAVFVVVQLLGPGIIRSVSAATAVGEGSGYTDLCVDMNLSIVNISIYYFDGSSSVSLKILLVLRRIVVIRNCDLRTNCIDTAAILHSCHFVAGMIRCIHSDLNIIGLVAGRKVDRELLCICQLVIFHICGRFIDRIGSTVDAVRCRIAFYLLAIHINVITHVLKTRTALG